MTRWREPVTLIRTDWKLSRALARLVAAETRRIVQEAIAQAERNRHMQTYRRRENTTINAVRLDLETEGFTYQKWGDRQTCKQGDWLVKNGADTYTIDATVFANTYRELSSGLYEKYAPVWAEQAGAAGSMPTKEGTTSYKAGDWLVFNSAEREDGYAMGSEKFEELYEPL